MASKKKLVYVVYYSMYGHVSTLARQVASGVEQAGGLRLELNFKQ